MEGRDINTENMQKQENQQTQTTTEEENTKLKEKIKELEDTNLRLKADFENYRKQLDREKEEFKKHANEKLILEILEVADNFERALPELKKKDPEGAEGMEMIYKQLMKVLEKAGTQYIETIGREFNPHLHEALIQEETDKPDGTILEELQKGYKLHGKVIRHSKVKVSKQKQ